MDISLQNKTALVCGSTQGIGLAAAIELSKLGADCILFARNEAALQAALLKLATDNNQRHNYLVADFSNTNQVKEVITGYASKNSIHILVNNSGGPQSGLISQAIEEDLVNSFNQHLVCNHIISKAVIPAMIEEGYGRIINIISTSVKIPLPNLGVSNTIRGAVASWAKTMANELGQYNITVNNVLPGATQTQRLETIISNNAKKKNTSVEAIEKEMQQEIPMKRFGKREEIAALIAFLASPAASYINGASIPVDGGRTGSI